MPRYIEVEKIRPYKGFFEKVDNVPKFYEWLETLPTADVVEVVRCKECFYAIPYNERWTLPKKNNWMWCKRYEDVRMPEWFCADGERRKDDAEIH